MLAGEGAGPLPPTRPPVSGKWRAYPVPHWNRDPFAETKTAGALWFRYRFRQPVGFSGESMALAFDAVRYRCDVYFNGTLLGTHAEGYSPFEFDLDDTLRPENEVAVRLLPPSTFEDAEGRRLLPVYYRPGIWQDVWLISRPRLRIGRVQILPSLRKKQLEVRIWVVNTGRQAQTVTLQCRLLLNEGPDFLPVTVDVPAGETGREISLGAAWPDPPLYWPHDPHLLVLAAELVSPATGDLLDRQTVRFGFREVRVSGTDILYNGERYVLRKGPWAPGGHWIHTPEQVFRMMHRANSRTGGAHAVRFHHSPPPPYYLDAADVCGVQVEEESAVFGGKYAWEEPAFWEAFGKHWSDLAARDANHPGIILDSIENESYWDVAPKGLAESGGLKRQVAERLAAIGREVSARDSTRPITYEGDGDLNGRADIVNLHYPNWISADPEFPARTRRSLDDHGKPLIVGEFAYEMTANPPRGLTSIMGRTALSGRLWRMGYTEAVRQIIEGYKLTGVDGYSAWDAPRIGTDPPVAIIMDSYCRHAWCGEHLPFRIWLVNSTLQGFEANLEWRLLWRGQPVHQGRSTELLRPNRPRRLSLPLDMPARTDSRRQLDLELRLYDGDHLRYRNVWPLLVYPRLGPPRMSSRTVVYDPTGKTRHLLADLGMHPAVIHDLTAANLDRVDAVLIGPDASPVKLAAACRNIEAFVCRGGRVAVLRQSAPPVWLPDPPMFDPDYRASLAFPVPGASSESILRGLDAMDLRWWRPDGRLTRSAFLASGEAENSGAIVEAGGGLGLAWAPMMLVPRSAGAYLLCQFMLMENLEREPAADLLFRRIVSWLDRGGKQQTTRMEPGRSDTHLLAQPLVGRILSAENAVTAKDAGTKNLPPVGTPVQHRLATLQDPGDAIAFVIPEDVAPGQYRLSAWVRTGERRPTDRVTSYQVQVDDGAVHSLQPGKQPPIFSHRGGDWAVWYGFGEVPESLELHPGGRIVVRAKASWLYIGHLLLQRHLALPKP